MVNKTKVREILKRLLWSFIPSSLGLHDFSWAVLPHVGHFLESDVPIAAYLYNSPLHRTSRPSWASHFEFEDSLFQTSQTVRSVPDDVKFQPELRHQAPFVVSGAHNVILETVKRGDDDDVSGSGPKTVVLRLYEAYGGHANVRLLLHTPVGIKKAIITNLLEDDNEDELGPMATVEEEANRGYSHFINLSFRGFEVKTIKLTLSSGAKG
jgi:alpha-mannosidase